VAALAVRQPLRAVRAYKKGAGAAAKLFAALLVEV
jgi:hypothetical protein